MKPSRRGFLGALAAALVLDPERLLWVPGKKLISIAAPPPEPLWLQISFPRYPHMAADWGTELDRCTLLLVREWHRREARAGRTLTPAAPPLIDPRNYDVYSRIDQVGRFSIRRAEAYDLIRRRYITRLDIATAGGIDYYAGAAHAPFVTEGVGRRRKA